ncbi:MAG: hypothetical protein ABIN01_14440 [Ferruginibacter sp.]
MQDEERDHMDELIKAASESYHPVYDDKAWEKMEALLDKHLPQKKGRKRPVLIFILLLIGATGLFALLYPWNEKENVAAIKQENKSADTGSKNLNIKDAAGDANAGAGISDNSTESLQGIRKKGTLNNLTKSFSARYKANKKIHIATKSSGGTMDEFRGNKKNELIENNYTMEDRDEVDPGNKKIDQLSSSSDPASDKLITIIEQPSKTDSLKINSIAVEPKEVSTAPLSKPATSKLKKDARGFKNNFAVTLSAGPDLSFVSLENPGRMKMSYGVGLGYTIARKINLRSGFYVVKKIYTAQSGDYHPPSYYWTNTADLQKVDADCNVFEIPLSASYNFGQSKKHNWLVGLGFSSFLMKRETYHYYYKNMQGQSMYKQWTLRNKNNHYFSVLTISGGYQYQLNRRFSFIAEPYFKVPLQGIGFGKIKLNSGGLVITASIKPFAKRN